MIVRFATEEDAKALLEVYAPFVTNTTITFETEIPSVEEFKSRIRHITPKYPYVVCEHEGQILGYAYAHEFRDRAAYDWTTELSVYVAPQFQRRGIATALYATVIKFLMEQGFYMAYGVISVPNPISELFHEALGFRVRGELDKVGYKMGMWLDTVYYRKPLQDRFDEIPRPVTPITALPQETVDRILQSGTDAL